MLRLHCLHMSVGHVHACSEARRVYWVFWNQSYKPLSLHVGAEALTLGPLQEHLVLLLLTMSPVHTRHSSLVSPTRENMFTQRPCKHPQELWRASATAPSQIPSFPLLSSQSWEPVMLDPIHQEKGTDMAALEQKSSALMATVCLGAWLRSRDTLFTNSNNLTVYFSLFLFLWVTLNICFQYNNVRNIIPENPPNLGEKCLFWSTLVRSATSGLWTGPLPVFLSYRSATVWPKSEWGLSFLKGHSHMALPLFDCIKDPWKATPIS